MAESLTEGLEGTAKTTVSLEKTAKAVGSGSLEVFATPMMVALMEKAAVNAVAVALSPGETTVGTKIEVSHIKASPVGALVEAKAKLISVEGRKLTFLVEAFDEQGKIGEGRHERVRVNIEKFLEKVSSREK
ncbi:thioesterase family protein [Carboxydothermus hydrogenoformans]|uniref:Thioesterase family protein n=1 Tax=Carboxydothermus hydrogenoformans (strain ATCC BAA-161 / DSM 6008 / Z-2901) TaxID=246194 RepID=Q3A9K1_CARHZ|nr:thioesterase family protein [Carboxydothermus hydrogenoformans]ABB15551.1 thioesterase family protein [Carboxydothermus hydrogenoformans Z-2901]